jgi:murein DD-endopeptidase MepM/ murein hydrolase activator NlpD
MWGVNVKRIVVWVCALVFLFSTTTSVLADEIDQHRNEAEEVNQEIEETQDLLDRVRGEQVQISNQLEKIDRDIREKEKELIHIQEKLDDTMALLDETKQELKAAEVEAKKFEKLMADRLCAMYMMEGTSYLELLFGARSLNEFLDRFEMVKFMIAFDNQVFDQMVELQNAIAEKKKELEIQEKAIRETKDEISQQKSLIEAKKSERLQVMIQLKDEEQQYEKDLEVLEQTSRDLEHTIQRLLKEQEQRRLEEEKKRKEEEQRRKEEEERRRKEEEQKRKAEEQGKKEEGGNKEEKEKGGGQQEQKDQDRGDNKGSSSMIWPVPGYNHISSGYGNRWHPVHKEYRMHTGIDISGGGINGKDAVAVADGTVILSQTYGGYGNCVIVDHGGGITTVYAHGSKLLVSVGQKVKSGQAVMKIGSTGVSTGPHLHFEVRKNGSHVNPLPYLGR